MRRFTPEERKALGPALALARWLLENAPDDLYEQLRETICGDPPPTSAEELADRVRDAEQIALAYRPPRRESRFRQNVRLLHQKGLAPREIAAEIGTTPNSVSVTLNRLGLTQRKAA